MVSVIAQISVLSTNRYDQFADLNPWPRQQRCFGVVWRPGMNALFQGRKRGWVCPLVWEANVENETKIIANGYMTLENTLSPFGWHDLAQGYLTPHNRVRSIISPDFDQQFYFTYKQRVANGHNLEIEAVISAAAFHEAWDYTQERLTKRRVSMMHRDLRWDVDFYRWSQPYFVVAEVEMPPDMQRPEAMLPYLVPHIVYEVPRDDDRFTARRLADETHVRTLARELGLLD
jgi:CYTH domain-containing protein